MATKSVSFAVTLIAADCAPLTCTVTKAELVASIYGGPRLTDGQFAPGGWDDAICADCGEPAAWCPELSRHLPATFVAARRSA